MIYEQRRQVLEGEDMSEQVKLWIDEIVEETSTTYTAEGVRGGVGSRGLTKRWGQLYGTEVTVAELRRGRR